jgi:putative acetyltransferase
MVTIREERPGDAQQIRIVNQRAFGQNEEANIMDKLRRTCPNAISLVAISGDQIVGHILFTPLEIMPRCFSAGLDFGIIPTELNAPLEFLTGFTPVTIQAEEKIITGMGLSPMAVLPEFQRQGIGSQLVKAGLEVIEKVKHPFVVVLGHPGYYPRFGFVPASRHRFVSEYKDVPDEAFMILVFDQSALKGVSGVAKYRPEFAAAI